MNPPINLRAGQERVEFLAKLERRASYRSMIRCVLVGVAAGNVMLYLVMRAMLTALELLGKIGLAATTVTAAFVWWRVMCWLCQASFRPWEESNHQWGAGIRRFHLLANGINLRDPLRLRRPGKG
ncbi:MAG: hypothetical protein PHE83_16545 [Opitutaceae bacterium]|nr:hypothetical protein [Opitutaceae bacterium]